MQEEFKICFESYEVSNFGNVRKKLLSGEYKILKCSILKTGKGYKYFQINREKKRINYLVHHLVAKLFIGERPDNLVIDHIDRNTLNNNISNLRYITQKENTHNTDRFIECIDEKDTKKRHKIVNKKYREEHKEEIQIKNKEYQDKNKEHIKEYLKKRYEDKKEELIKKTQIWYENNKEKRKEYMKRYRELNLDKLREKDRIRNNKNQ